MGQNNTVAKKKTIKLADLVITDELIKNYKIPRSDLFQVELKGQTLGPFWGEDLKNCISAFGHLLEEAHIRSLEDKGWKNFFEHPLFNRRRPEVVTTTEGQLEEDNQKLYLIHHGQRSGPITLEEINKRIKQGSISLNDYVGVGEESTKWKKVCQLPGFNRRKKKDVETENLPAIPQEEVFEHSAFEATRIVNIQTRPNAEDSTQHSLANLIQLNQVRQKRLTEMLVSSRRSSLPESLPEVPEMINWKEIVHSKKFKIVTLCTLGLLISVWLLAPRPKNELSTLPHEIAPTNLTGIALPKNNNNTLKKSKFSNFPNNTNPAPAINRPNSTSFRKSKAISRRDVDEPYAGGAINTRSANDEGIIYDDGSGPIEIDPIRQKLTREMIDADYAEAEAPATSLDDQREQAFAQKLRSALEKD
ncbi:MAG: hypothetical protein WCG27_10150, partial [Pseudomonadota bacterium]